MHAPPRSLDLHQHVWTQPLIDALAARHCLPFVRRSPEGLNVLHCQGERPYVIEPEDLAGDVRTRERRLGGAHQAVIALSSPIGIEALGAETAAELIDVHLQAVLALGPQFAAWGPLRLADPSPEQVDDLLHRGCVGISVSAGALADRDQFDRLLSALQRVEEHDSVVFVHPGPGAHHHVREPALTEPLWWPALTRYVQEMQAAWLTFTSYGRRELPRLRVVFTMLAGGGPLLAERLLARGGPQVDLPDPMTFYDTSSFGPRMVKTMARWVGPSQLVYGSDRPVVEPVLTGRESVLMENAGRLLAQEAAVA